MAQAANYQVSFPFGAITSPYSRLSPHRGDDYPCPVGTPVMVNNMLIGHTGNTGYVVPAPTVDNPNAGRHLHVSRWVNGQAVVPGNVFSLPGAVVLDTGYNATDGNFVRLKCNGSVYAYCHLDSTAPLRPGMAVAGEGGRGAGPTNNEEPDMVHDTDNEYGRWAKLGRQIRGRDLSREEFRRAAVGLSWLRAMEILSDSQESDANADYAAWGRPAKNDNWPGQIQALAGQLPDVRKELLTLQQTPALTKIVDMCQVDVTDLPADGQSIVQKLFNAVAELVAWATKRKA